MWQTKENLVGQMLGEQDGPFTTTGWTQVEPLTREGPEVIMATLRVGTADPRYTLQIVSTRGKPLTDSLDTLKAVHAVGGGVLLIILLAEVGEVAFEYSMEFVATTGNVPVRRHGRDRDCRAHINIYGRNELPASQTAWVHRSQHNMPHSPVAFSSLSLLRGRW